jgi:hypothetical protein
MAEILERTSDIRCGCGFGHPSQRVQENIRWYNEQMKKFEPPKRPYAVGMIEAAK